MCSSWNGLNGIGNCQRNRDVKVSTCGNKECGLTQNKGLVGRYPGRVVIAQSPIICFINFSFGHLKNWRTVHNSQLIFKKKCDIVYKLRMKGIINSNVNIGTSRLNLIALMYLIEINLSFKTIQVFPTAS